jgi:Domain of unknown function (DUF4349)
MMRIRFIVACLLQAGLMACEPAMDPARQQKDDSQGVDVFATRSADVAAGSVPGLVANTRAAPETAAAASPEELSARTYPDPASGMIIRTGNASVEVDSLDPGLAALRTLTLRLGGYVANTSIQGGRDQVRRATVELKVPADRFDELTGGLDPLGKVEFVNVSAQDVGEEFVDLSARAANARKLEERLIEVLATRTGKLQDVLSVERELARVREEIERLDGRMRYLKSRTAYSTLAIHLHEPPPVVGTNPGRGIIAEAFLDAWRNFVELVAAVIASLGYVVPAAVLLWLATLFGRRWRRQPA